MTDDFKPQMNKITLITKKGVMLPTIKTQTKVITPRGEPILRGEPIGNDSKAYNTNQDTKSVERPYAVLKYIKTGDEYA